MTRPKKIILISIDTLRSDHLGCYGYQRNTSPAIDLLAGKGIIFKNTFSPSSHTIPSHGSMFTGKYPSKHSIGFNQNIFVETGKLNTDIDITLAEILRSIGFKTAAFVSGIVLSKKTNLNAGFNEYDDDIGNDAVGRRACIKTNERILDWLDHNVQEDFFLFIHYFDIHGPYISPSDYQSFFSSKDYETYPEKINAVSGPNPEINTIPLYQVLNPKYDANNSLTNFETNIRYYIAQYDSCVRYLDDNIGLLFEKLRQMGIFDDTLIIITSDHGEAFGENDIYFYHGLTVTREQINIPLIIKPHREWNVNAATIDLPASSPDIMPTLLELCSYSFDDPDIQGHSLKKIIEGCKDQFLRDRVLMSENERQYTLFVPELRYGVVQKGNPIQYLLSVYPRSNRIT